MAAPPCAGTRPKRDSTDGLSIAWLKARRKRVLGALKGSPGEGQTLTTLGNSVTKVQT